MKVDSLFCEDYIQYMSSLSIKYNFTNVKDGFFFFFKVKLLICYGSFALMSRNIVYFLSRFLCSYIKEITSFYVKVAYGMCQKLNLLPK